MTKMMAAATSEIRTRPFPIQFKFMFVFLLCLKSVTQANQIHADDIDIVQKIPLVHDKHAVTQTNDGSTLRATGFSTEERKFVQFKATHSPDRCDDNSTDLFVQAVESSFEPHRFRLHNDMDSGHNMDLLISLENFNFDDKGAAYVCAKWKEDMDFVHMGTNSKFERWVMSLITHNCAHAHAMKR